MNQNGFFLIYRKLFTNDIWKNPIDLRLFLFVLGHAVFSDEGVESGGVKVQRGQFLRSYRNLQKDLEYKEKQGYKQYGLATIKRSITRLARDELVTVIETPNGTLFEVVNYEKYQGFKGDKEKGIGTGFGTECGTGSEQVRNNNNNVTKSNNVLITNNNVRKNNYERHHLKLAELLFKKIKENNPSAKQPNLESWANTFRLTMERDKRTGEEVQALILWSQQHHFWYKNILSANKLREQYDRLLVQMKDDKNLKVIDGGKKNAVAQTSYQNDSSKYDFTRER